MQDEPTEAVFKEEDAPIQFIIDLIDQRAESNAQEIEVTHYFITNNVYGAETELRNEFKSGEATEDVRGHCYAEGEVGKNVDAERPRSDRKFRISTLEGVAERSNESENAEPNHHVRGRFQDELKVDKIAVPNHSIRGSVIATEGSDFGR